MLSVHLSLRLFVSVCVTETVDQCTLICVVWCVVVTCVAWRQTDCDQWAPGIEIIAVRVTKPRVPDKILQGFVQIENEKTQLQISVEEQRVAEKRAETRRKEAGIKAQGELEVAEIQLRMKVANQEAR